MPYIFTIKSLTTRRVICPSKSIINNTFIDYTAQGFKPTDVISNSAAAIWVTNIDPLHTQEGYSAPVKLYNPFTSRFLGDTEEITQISNYPQSSATIAGALSFESADVSSHFMLRLIRKNEYQILLHESENNYLNQKKLILDIENNSRILISKDNIQQTEKMDDLWEISHIFN